MTSFHSYLLRKIYKKVHKLGDRLAKIEPHIDWNAFTHIIQSIYTNNTPMGGRPNVDLVVMMKLLVLQSWYGRARGGVGLLEEKRYGAIRMIKSKFDSLAVAFKKGLGVRIVKS